MNLEVLSYIFSFLGLVSIIGASLIKGKRMKSILALVFTGNVLVATSYLIEGKGINGAASCYLGSVQAITSYFFDSKNKPLPKWLISAYIISEISLNIWIAQGITLHGLIVIAAGLAFIMSIVQHNGAKYRLWTLLNLFLWCVYDAASKSYSVLYIHILQLGITVIGMILHDLKKADNINRI